MAGKTKNVIAKRPRKSGAERRRRVKSQTKRLMALGVPEEKLKNLTVTQTRTMLKEKLSAAQKSLG